MLPNRISIDPNVCHGQACVRGTRLPVHQIVRMIANGDSPADLVREWTLWNSLRGGRLDGLEFRGQCPVGPYVADVCCL